MTRRAWRQLLLGSAVLLAVAGPARADLLVNGGFESTNFTGSSQFGDNYAGGVNQVTGWTTNGYNWLYQPGQADDLGVANGGTYGNVWLWGPRNGAANGLPDTSPAGGNYVAADGAFGVSPISQLVSGLVPGANYAVTFWWAGAQQYGFDGPNTEQWAVSLGADTQYTPVLDNASHGFTGWQQSTMTFTARAATETLAFLAIGTPPGVPPFSLLDGVTMNAVPEPSTLVAGVGLVALGGLLLRRRRAG